LDRSSGQVVRRGAKRRQRRRRVECAVRLFNGTGLAKDEAAAAMVQARREGSVRSPECPGAHPDGRRGLTADPVQAAKWHILAGQAGISNAG
jgi:hypothetical protein